jgi:hypothetical protein
LQRRVFSLPAKGYFADPLHGQQKPLKKDIIDDNDDYGHAQSQHDEASHF